VGAEPVAITNCLNFGNPYDPKVYWTFKEAIRGMGDACRAFNTPVTGGNVSFHNESRNRAINPTPTIGMLGLINDITKICSADFKREDEDIYLIGNDREELGGSEYLKQVHDVVKGNAPILDIEEEMDLQKAVLTAIRAGLVSSAHDCSEGGLAICLAEKAILSKNNIGCKIDLGDNPAHGKLFGESQSRIVVSLKPENVEKLSMICKDNNVSIKKIGTTIKDSFIIKNAIDQEVDKLRYEYESVLPSYMK
jgi:phosphoribosylformylglycinamidine (FGAM) synthase-like enzyme